MSMIVALAGLLAGTQAPADVVGRWKTESRNGVVEITRCGPSICGRLVSSDGIRASPQLKDAKNKDAAQRSRTLKGVMLIWGFTGSGGEWTGGQIYNPEDGKTYKSTVTLENPTTLKVRGCIFVPLCKTQRWTRIG
jgi:uncharacterized protein (DUF2147 family)